MYIGWLFRYYWLETNPYAFSFEYESAININGFTFNFTTTIDTLTGNWCVFHWRTCYMDDNNDKLAIMKLIHFLLQIWRSVHTNCIICITLSSVRFIINIVFPMGQLAMDIYFMRCAIRAIGDIAHFYITLNLSILLWYVSMSCRLYLFALHVQLRRAHNYALQTRGDDQI